MKSRNLVILEIIIFKYKTIHLAKKTLGQNSRAKMLNKLKWLDQFVVSMNV